MFMALSQSRIAVMTGHDETERPLFYGHCRPKLSQIKPEQVNPSG
jgi:hypothetical protein